MVRLSSALMNENDPDGDYQKGVFINALSEAAIALLLARDLATIGVRVVSIAPEILESLEDKDEDCLPLWESRSEAFAKLAENIVENPMINGTVIKMRRGTTALEHWESMRSESA